jgi:hypothetical protein
VKKLKEFYHLLIKLQLNVKLLLRVKITILIFQELNLKNSAWIFSENAYLL